MFQIFSCNRAHLSDKLTDVKALFIAKNREKCHAADYQETLEGLTHKATKYIAQHRLTLRRMTLEPIEALREPKTRLARLQDALGPTPILAWNGSPSLRRVGRAQWFSNWRDVTEDANGAGMTLVRSDPTVSKFSAFDELVALALQTVAASAHGSTRRRSLSGAPGVRTIAYSRLTCVPSTCCAS